MNGRSLMNVSDGCPTLTCLSLKLRRCYFYVISTVSMTLVIIIRKLGLLSHRIIQIELYYYYYICISFIIVH